MPLINLLAGFSTCNEWWCFSASFGEVLWRTKAMALLNSNDMLVLLILLLNVSFYGNVDAQKNGLGASFIFGDSLVDAGNNNYLSTLSKANIPPNGIDFKASGGNPTGRYTNGRTIGDLVGNFVFFLTHPRCLGEPIFIFFVSKQLTFWFFKQSFFPFFWMNIKHSSSENQQLIFWGFLINMFSYTQIKS